MSDNTQSKKSSEWRERELGALWSQKGQNREYMTGHFLLGDSKQKVVIFKNQNKTNDHAPDYVIYKHVERDGNTSNTQSASMSSGSDNLTATEEIPELLA